MTQLSGTTTDEIEILRSGGNLADISRLSSAFAHHYDIVGFWDYIATANRTEYPTKFEPEALRSMNRLGWVYALAHNSGEVLYIGKTKRRLPDRIYEHYAADGRLNRLARQAARHADWVFGWNVGDSAARFEKAAIMLLQPPYNTVGVV